MRPRVFFLASLALLYASSAAFAAGLAFWGGIAGPHSTFTKVTAKKGGASSSCADLVVAITASTAIPVGQGATVEVGLPAGANALSRRKDVCGPFVIWRVAVRAAGGDTCCTPGGAIPVSYIADGSADMSCNQVSDTQIDFYLNWSGSDSGVVACIEWYDSGTDPPTLLNSTYRTGPWMESTTISVTALTSADNIQFYAASEAYSIEDNGYGGVSTISAGSVRKRK